jgi:hypothetical protein
LHSVENKNFVNSQVFFSFPFCSCGKQTQVFSSLCTVPEKKKKKEEEEDLLAVSAQPKVMEISLNSLGSIQTCLSRT